MTETVDDIRNEIRVAVGRFEREISATFTKEDLESIRSSVCEGTDAGERPSKATMRADILRAVDAEANPKGLDRSFRKAELESIAIAVSE